MISFIGCILAACFPNIADMPLEEKIGQLFIVHFNGEEVNEEATVFIEELHVGGFIYYNWANGLTSPLQVQRLSNGLQRLAKIPLFISIDQEGGKVSRLNEGFTVFCGNGAIGMTNEPVFAEQVACAMGEEMCAVGINLNFAPVVDVMAPFDEALIDRRSFGSCPEAVALFGERSLHGFHQACILTTLKHFPGIGEVSVDPHLDLPVLNKSLDYLSNRELYPFKELIHMTDLVMTAHVMVPALDARHCATLSRPILEDFLRGELGFKGIIISDSLIMEGLLKQVFSIEEAAIQAFEAGCDLLLLGGKQLLEGQDGFELELIDVARIHRALVRAVEEGRIPEKRVDDSLKRILCAKKTLSIESPSEEEINTHVRTDDHERLARRVLNRSLHCAKPAQAIE
ncbi:MAG: glycoside hydrolase family 3 protein [Chlamydiota bacterium]